MSKIQAEISRQPAEKNHADEKNKTFLKWIFSEKALAANLAAILTVASALCGAGYTMGMIKGKSDMDAAVADMKVTIGVGQAKLEALQGKLDQSIANETRYREALNQYTQSVAQKDAAINDLTTKVSVADNCLFVQKELRKLQQRLSDLDFVDVFVSGGGGEEQKAQERKSIEERIARYQEKFGPNGCK